MLTMAALLLLSLASAGTSSPFSSPVTIGGAISDWLSPPYGYELEVWNHTVTTPNGIKYGAFLNHFWSAGGKGAVGQYIADRQVLRYYIDGESTPSIVFEPAMAAGNGMGWEMLPYYKAGLHEKEPWGSETSTTWMGHSASTGGGWHNRFKVPFSNSIRVTVQLPLDVPTNATSKMFIILRGVEGDARPLQVGDIALPPTVSCNFPVVVCV
jgi:hypothetical protein